MARKFILENLMKLAQGIGANPNKFMGTRTNITFLGKGPTKNPLFQGPLRGIESATEAQLGPRETIIEAVEDAMGFATANKLNSIQIRALELNLQGLNKIYNPPVLPMATVTKFPKQGSGITSLEGADPRETILPTSSLMSRITERMKNIKGTSSKLDDAIKGYEDVYKPRGPRLPEPGTAGVTAMLDQKTGMSRAIARNLLLKDTRLKLKPEELFMLKEGKGEPLDLMRKYYGESMHQYDDFLNSVNLEAARPDEFAEMVLKHIKLVPQFAHGGLARILEV